MNEFVYQLRSQHEVGHEYETANQLVLRAPVDSRLLLAPEGTTLSFITK